MRIAPTTRYCFFWNRIPTEETEIKHAHTKNWNSNGDHTEAQEMPCTNKSEDTTQTIKNTPTTTPALGIPYVFSWRPFVDQPQNRSPPSLRHGFPTEGPLQRMLSEKKKGPPDPFFNHRSNPPNYPDKLEAFPSATSPPPPKGQRSSLEERGLSK